MATEPHVSTLATGSPEVSAIENELPAYRAISPLAVFSVLMGALAVMCFVDFWFLIAGALAVVAGAYAEHRIRKMPDILTGRGLAQGGIALGLVFSLSSVTFYWVQRTLITRDATAFAKQYTAVLSSRKLEDALWYRLPPGQRKGSSPDEVHKRLQATRDPAVLQQIAGPIQTVISSLTGQGEKLTFVEIESIGTSEIESTGRKVMGPYAVGVLQLDIPKGESTPARRELVGVILKAEVEGGKNKWWVDQVIYPYHPATYVAPVAPLDDGHGHGH